MTLLCQSLIKRKYEDSNDITNESLNSNLPKHEDNEGNKLSQVGLGNINPQLEKDDEFQLAEITNSSIKSKGKSKYGSIIDKHMDA
ncbi:MAG: hypothetical protein EZS28_013899 [Streblomastix strix]|uniref:Uncharacterized protein n=1 Tax=Streblomastix strix TaxID=222440 RepID=A0A5J4W6M8_9EUKA|nr:MAG: hypothetical protein EZS28_013899 [Streblomastix strix]